MKRKRYSYSGRYQKKFHSSSFVILALTIILAVIIGDFFMTSRNSSQKNTSQPTEESSDANNSTSNNSIFRSKSDSSPSPTIVIDAGHGGPDPGKVSESGTLEKDINLQIALYLKEMLEAQNFNIVMTREEDKDLATETSQRKLSDIKERVKLMESSNPAVVISIHQNSYPDASVYGAQCFYPTESEAGKNLADIIQKQIITSTNQTKIREIKGNNDYYLLKNSPAPIVIVECGFLTNPEEEKLLLAEDYQRKMAWSIHLGILEYLNNTNASNPS